jgi:hypothetical protein
MSDGRELLDAARRAQSAERADDLARQAILAAPDLADAYLVRGQLAVHRGDAAAAAFHLRVAFARGARDGFTRDVLARFLEVSGQLALANRMRAGVTPAAQLKAIETLGLGTVAEVRDALSRPLPAPGTPGLLPREARASSTSIAGDMMPRNTAPLPGLPPQQSEAPLSLPPAETPAPRNVVSQVPRAPNTGPFGAPLRPPSGPIAPVGPAVRGPTLNRVNTLAPDWLETTPEYEGNEAKINADWLDDALPPVVDDGGVHFGGGGIELAFDPGVVEGGFVSPVTGARVSAAAQEQDRRGASMPQVAGGGDDLEGQRAFVGRYDIDTLQVAVLLPGPVLTRPGRPPQTLTRNIALALKDDMLLMADLSTPSAPIQELPLTGFERVDVISDGRQVSLVYGDGRALHLDLRPLRARSMLTAVKLLDLVGRRVAALG